jgi:hypothetical protein
MTNPMKTTPTKTAQPLQLSQEKTRYLVLAWRDEYGVPSGLCASYFADCPGDREYVLNLRNKSRDFQLVGDFANIDLAQASVTVSLKQTALMVPFEERQKWPSSGKVLHYAPVTGHHSGRLG